MTTPTPTTTTTNETVTLRSRHPNYRWRGVQFENHMAQVSEAQAEAARRDPFFGVGRDFWIDAPAAPTATAGGGKNAAPALSPNPVPLDAAELPKLNKAALADLAEARGIEIADTDTKAQIIDKLTSAATAA
jgi:hypothetical protein